jgi:formate dehydrogenase subunit gamma
VAGYAFGRAHGMPPQGRINAGQKLHHAGTFVCFVTVALSGLLLWFAKSYLGGSGVALAAMIHDLSMLLLTVLLIGHVYFTFVYGALPGMVTGYVSEDYARMEHAKWLESLSKPDREE